MAVMINSMRQSGYIGLVNCLTYGSGDVPLVDGLIEKEEDLEGSRAILQRARQLRTL